MDYQERIINHYGNIFGSKYNICYWDRGPAHQLPYDFRILEFSPQNDRSAWVYSTVCMSQEKDSEKIELHVFSAKQDPGLIEILTAVAYYHRLTNKLSLNHSVNFGKPWQDQSECTYGFISLPYMDGPDLETLLFNKNSIKFYWLIPITQRELNYKKQKGVDALELLFENKHLDYLNPQRKSLI